VFGFLKKESMADNSDLMALFADDTPSTLAKRILGEERVEFTDAESGKDKKSKEKIDFRLTPEQEAERLTRTFFLGNLPSSVKKDEIKKLVKPFGKVEKVRIRGLTFGDDIKTNKKIAAIKGKYDANASCFAYVVMEKMEECHAAIKGLKDSVFKEHTLKTDIAQPPGTKKKPSHEVNQRTIFIGSLKSSITEEELRSVFSACGDIENIHIPKDKTNGKSRNVAFITYKDDRAMEMAIKFNGALLQDRPMTVMKSTPAKAEKMKQKKLEKKQNSKKPVEKKSKDKKPSDKSAPKEEKKPSFEGMKAKKMDEQNTLIKKYLKMRKAFKNKKDK